MVEYKGKAGVGPAVEFLNAIKSEHYAALSVKIDSRLSRATLFISP